MDEARPRPGAAPAAAAEPAEGDPAERLWRLWRRGEQPDVREFLARSGVHDPAQVIGVLRVDQREHWRLGRRVRAESYLEALPALRDDAAAACDLVYGEVLLRQEGGEETALEDVARRFPELAEALQDRSARDQTRPGTTAGPAATRAAPESTAPADPAASRAAPESTAADDPAATRAEPGSTAADDPAATRAEPGSTAAGDPAATRAAPAAETAPTTLPCPVAGPPSPSPSLPRDPSWPIVAGHDILGVLGRGGMGVVYRAYDRKRGTTVALKTVLRANPTALYHFKQEFRTLLDLSHPNLVNLYELISDGRDWFFTMEWIDGVHFLESVRSGFGSGRDGGGLDPAPEPGAAAGGPAAAAAVLSTAGEARLRAGLRQLAEGLVALHDAGKLHRDIKPGNVLVTRSGRVVLLDFGLAIDLEPGARDPSTEGDIVGTASYMAPEQAAGLAVTPAADWYSVGVILFEALTGRPPFTGRPLQVLMDKQRDDPVPPSALAAGVPEDLAALCVALLRRAPEARPSGRDVLRSLGGAGGPPVPPAAPHPSRGPSGPLIGRDRHLEALAGAFATMTRGRPVLLCVHGRSGVGKSLLVQRFLDGLRHQTAAVVLAGRCFERETVPYKALDSLVDALSRYLRHLPAAEARALLPRDVLPLARVFPVLRRVEAVSDVPRRADEVPDPQELRRRAFTALRELLARLGDRAPLVLALDDLQWGDSDSAALLAELLRPPDPPVLLLIASYRAEDVATSPFLEAFLRPKGAVDPVLDRRELAVAALSRLEAAALARALLVGDGDDDPCAADQAAAIARESGGNPFFVAELVRSLQAGAEAGTGTGASGCPSPAAAITLDEVLWERVGRLPDDARRLLEVVAVSGRPVRPAEAVRSAGLTTDERGALALLRAARLVRGTGTGTGDEGAIETYHDRVRETVVAHLPAEVLRELHQRLGLALEASGTADPEDLGAHFLAAGDSEKAGDYFGRAAEQAAEALAFDRAVKLYRLALELRPRGGDEGRASRCRLGDALANAGRGAEAAREYLAAAAAGATVAEALELRRRAAMQFLISGHVDDGLATLRAVLEAVGMTLPPSPGAALRALLLRRAWLRLRGLGFRERDPSEVAAADLTRIDVCWSAAAGLSVVDTIRGADFQARGLLLALRAGEGSRIARSLAMEAAHAATRGTPGRRHTSALLEAAAALAGRGDDPYVLGMVTLARGTADYLAGAWTPARDHCDRAAALFRDRCTGVAWELDTVQAFGLWALSHLGATAELARRWPALLEEARGRGDLYAVMNLSTYLMSVVRLAAGEPAEARAELRQTMARWSRQGYHVQHNDALWAAVQIALYQGDGRAAQRLLDEAWPALARSLLLRVQFLRVAMWSLRGRSALAASAGAQDPRPDLHAASSAARRLEREPNPVAAAHAALLRAGLHNALGNPSAAAEGLAGAARLYDAAEMRLCASAARRRLGILLGGPEGAALVAGADALMAAEAVRDPARMTAMYAPGFPETS